LIQINPYSKKLLVEYLDRVILHDPSFATTWLLYGSILGRALQARWGDGME
jgi:hypothetical protein